MHILYYYSFLVLFLKNLFQSRLVLNFAPLCTILTVKDVERSYPEWKRTTSLELDGAQLSRAGEVNLQMVHRF